MIVEAKGAARQFFRKRAESNVFYAVAKTDLVLEPGTLTVLSGRSGSGKSTLMNMIAGLLQPSEGIISVDGKDLYSMNDAELSVYRNRQVGMVPQVQSAISSLNTVENILLPYTLFDGKTDASAEGRAETLMGRLGIADLKKVMPSELSGGELRRMAICRALVRDPQLILADEPTGDLDEESTKAVMGLFRESADAGKTVLLVTHDREVLSYADRAYNMESGVLSDAVGIT